MAPWLKALRGEFRLRQVGFTGISEERFTGSQWRIPHFSYVAYRFVLMIYAVFWLIRTAILDRTSQGWGAYLTNWTYLLLAVYLTLHFLLACHQHVRCGSPQECTLSARAPVHHHVGMFAEAGEGGRSGEWESLQLETGRSMTAAAVEQLPPGGGRPPWFMCIVWALFSVVSTAAILVSIAFFAFIFPQWKDGSLTSEDTLQLHLLNSVIVIVEHIVTALPCRLLHVIYPTLYAVVYLLFSVVFWATDHTHVMYSILDWNKPGRTGVFLTLLCFVFLPLIHGFLFAVYQVKMLIFRFVYRAEIRPRYRAATALVTVADN